MISLTKTGSDTGCLYIIKMQMKDLNSEEVTYPK